MVGPFEPSEDATIQVRGESFRRIPSYRFGSPSRRGSVAKLNEPGYSEFSLR